MGGDNETTLSGDANLRLHDSSGDVHIHDDATGTKFRMPVKQFKVAYARTKALLRVQQPPYRAEITDANGVHLVGELDQNLVEWRLEVGKRVAVPVGAEEDADDLEGLGELDDFLGNY